MWVLLLLMMTPTGQVAGYVSMAMPDHETCMVMGEDMTRRTATLDTYHCFDLEALMAEGAGS